MSVRAEDGVILLEGNCPAEDAETLLQLLQQPGTKAVEVGGMGRPHTAVIQVLMAASPEIRGVPDDAFIRDRLIPLIKVGMITAPTGEPSDPL